MIKLQTIGRKFLNEQRNSLSHKRKLIFEQSLQGKTIINVDIQPEYESGINFLPEWVNFINQNNQSNTIVFLYNGHDTLGMTTEENFRYWLYDQGINEDVIDNAIFYDKGYAFFSYCIDSGIDHDNIVDIVKFMSNHNITDSREINEDMWNQYMEETNHDQDDVRDLLENAGDCIAIPDLMDELSRYNNIVVTGGGINECLKEVEIALMANGQKYNILHDFTY